MSYGRLDVFWPEGKFETFALNDDTISVGRSAGNTLVLDTDTISRYHLSITRENGQTYLTDLESVNGTFVDGVRLPGNDRVMLNGGEELQVGYLRMIYHQSDESPTVRMAASPEETARVERKTPDFRIDLQAPPIAVAPGAYTSAELNVTNTSENEQVYVVQVADMPEGWIRVNRPVLELEAGESALVLINIKPLRRSESSPGEYTANVSVYLQEQPEKKLEVPFKVRILAYSGFGMALATRRIGHRDRFKLHLHNQGSAPLPLQIVGRDAHKKLHYNFAPAQVTLGPGQRALVQGTVKPLNPSLFGGMIDYPFDLMVYSHDPSHFTASIRGHLLFKPLFPLWMGGVILTLLVIGVMLVVFGLGALLNRTPTPQIDRFTVNSGVERVRASDGLQLAWAVTNAQEISVKVNDIVILSGIDPQPGTAQISAAEYNGPVRVELIAVNRDKTTSIIRELDVFQPITITDFRYSPEVLTRNVIHTLTIHYHVPGAMSVSLSGLDNVAQPPLPAPISNSGSIAVVILPLDNFSLTLNAIDADGESVQQTLNIALRDAVCSTSNNADLYEAPNADTNVVSTVSGLITVTARDPNAQWLQTTVNNLTLWAPRADFTCSGFDVNDLRVVQVGTFPTPTNIAPPLTVVPTRTATPNVTATIDPTGN